MLLQVCDLAAWEKEDEAYRCIANFEGKFKAPNGANVTVKSKHAFDGAIASSVCTCHTLPQTEWLTDLAPGGRKTSCRKGYASTISCSYHFYFYFSSSARHEKKKRVNTICCLFHSTLLICEIRCQPHILWVIDPQHQQ
jgi:hypothetical protein